jgi:hypothetical protein
MEGMRVEELSCGKSEMVWQEAQAALAALARGTAALMAKIELVLVWLNVAISIGR